MIPSRPGPVAFLLATLCALGLWSAPLHSATGTPRVTRLRLRDTIQPISAEYLSRAIDSAATSHSSALLVEISTPGGLLDSTRSMVEKIESSPVPVILYVSPTGSRAASAGFFLLEAADVAAMAPGTNTGAAHPVLEGQKLDPVMKEKLENDAAAFMRSYVSRRGRNPAAADAAIRASKSYTDSEALELRLIDLVAASDTDLFNQLDGRTVTRFDGSSLVLHTRDAQFSDFSLTLREKILDALMDPNLAVLLLIVGGLLIYLEFNTPGTVVPGSIGALLVLLSLFALNLLPLQYTSLALLVAGLALMMLEAKIPSHGVLAFSGIAALVFGLLLLIDGPIPELRVRLATALAAGIAFGSITITLASIAWRARRRKALTGVAALIGETAVVQTPLDPAGPLGQVLVHGELWQARSATPCAAGAPVRIRSADGLTLAVEPLPPLLQSR